MSIAGKILARVLLNRLNEHLEQAASTRKPVWIQERQRNNRHDLYSTTASRKMPGTECGPPHSLIRGFFVRMKKLFILGYPNCAKRRFWSGCANAQSNLNPHWAHMYEGTYSDVSAYISFWETILGLIYVTYTISFSIYRLSNNKQNLKVLELNLKKTGYTW